MTRGHEFGRLKVCPLSMSSFLVVFQIGATEKGSSSLPWVVGSAHPGGSARRRSDPTALAVTGRSPEGSFPIPCGLVLTVLEE